VYSVRHIKIEHYALVFSSELGVNTFFYSPDYSVTGRRSPYSYFVVATTIVSLLSSSSSFRTGELFVNRRVGSGADRAFFRAKMSLDSEPSCRLLKGRH
jgi:hypothetical protein